MKINKFKKSPIAYMGSKYSLLKKLEPLLPNNISKIYDVFGGSGTMSINFGESAEYNEHNPFTTNIVKFSIENSKLVIEQCLKWFDRIG